MDVPALKQSFRQIFGSEADAVFFSPGRINLIGEHTDYNGGHVFPCAITLGTYGAARKRADEVLRFYSDNFAEAGIIVETTDKKRNRIWRAPEVLATLDDFAVASPCRR